ncbi:LysR family transcriptional regulator [Roseovarius sp. ZX-A-9]|uniref:LysR family transcriptional regulator n=1 Tax=Roseovarius sp. ZX-A-9 TaxID=3014783 RepID=UPI00232ED2AE|nr:LysR family transcriptional regulator [Roseovarius sp. ZX-A-9]
MPNPYRRLPPLGALVGFEAAARLGSFSLAADELNVTQSAISHQIRTLEGHLGQPLFLRTGRRVELTDAGRDLLGTSAAALETVRQGVRRLAAYTKPGSVVVLMPPAIARGWFLPRLPAFRAAHPGIEPWLATLDTEMDLSEAEIDIAIRLTPAQEVGARAVPFLRDDRAPMAAPELDAAFARSPETVPLVHDESPDDWQRWFDAAGVERADISAGLNFDDHAMALDAAAQGLGVFLGNPVLAKDRLADGRLRQVGAHVLESERVFHLVALERTLHRQSVRVLWDWLCAQASLAEG